MKQFQKHIIFILLFIMGGDIFAKESHFSQFYALPITLNPALTGIVGSDYRIAGIYRSQWSGFSPILTQSLSFETHKDITARANAAIINKLGLGGMVLRDQGGVDAGLATTSVYGSISDYMDLGSLYLSFGIQPGFVQRGLFGTSTFPDQYDPAIGELVEGIPGKDHAQLNYQVNYFDVNAGLLAIFKLGEETNNAIHIGASGYHLSKPSEIFITSTKNNITPSRFVGHLGGRFKLSTASPISIIPNAIYMTVPYEKAQEVNFGVDTEYDFSQTNGQFAGMVAGGLYFRPNDAVIVHGALGLNNFLIGFSYDLNISQLRQATNLNGGFELSIRFEPEPKGKKKRMIHNPCPVI